MQFSRKILPNNRFALPLWKLTPPSRKSWIRHYTHNNTDHSRLARHARAHVVGGRSLFFTSPSTGPSRMILVGDWKGNRVGPSLSTWPGEVGRQSRSPTSLAQRKGRGRTGWIPYLPDKGVGQEVGKVPYLSGVPYVEKHLKKHYLCSYYVCGR